jgi:glycosyltransferase involved in cell wall biosynthesis
VRITFILPVFSRSPAGGFRVVYEYANRLVGRGDQVTVVHERWREGWRRPLAQLRETARDLWYDTRPGGLARSVRWMTVDPRVRMTLVRRLEPDRLPPADVVVATYWTTALLLPALAPRHGVPVHLVQGYEIWGVPDVAEVHRALRLNIAKVAVSHHLAGVLQRLGVPGDRITVVPNGLDHEIFRPPAQVTTRRNSVAVLLSHSQAKGMATVLAAVDRVRQRVPDVTVNAFGVEPAPNDLPAWVRYFRGLHGPELVRRVYRRSAVYLCGSVSEGWGFPVAEAMACGAAVVSTRNGGVEDFCVHEKNALLVGVGDVDAMADAVTTLLLDHNLRTRLVEAAAETAATMDWSASTDMFRDALAVPARR